MKKLTRVHSVASKAPPAKLGPGEYRPAGVYQHLEELPKPKIIKQPHEALSQPCPHCGQPAARHRGYRRHLYDVGDLLSGRPRLLEVSYSQHYCATCRKYFNQDLSDLAAPKSLYTHRVQDLAVRLVVDDSLPYRTASWHLWRDHRLFVPFATIQNWVEAGGKKGQ